MAWLGTWASRIEFSIGNTNIDAALSDFPIQVYLSAASGIGDVDVSAIFDELASDANRKKIAVTTSDGTTQCNVEIERWDDASEKAWLWVKVPSVSASAKTILYIYYDSAQPDNTTYIGDTGDTPAQGVWDSNFKLVAHMAQDPNGDVADAIKDSTSNVNHGTPNGTMTTADLVDGKIGKELAFDGTDDYLDYGDNPDLEGMPAITVEVILTLDVLASVADSYYDVVCKYDDGTDKAYHLSIIKASDILYFQLATDINNVPAYAMANDATAIDTPYYCAGTWDSADPTVRLFIDSVLQTTTANITGASVRVNDERFAIGAAYHRGLGSANHVVGKIDEVRISGIARSAAWIKATHHSNEDALIVFSTGVTITVAATVPMMTALAGTGATADATCPMMIAEGLTGITAEATIPMQTAAATLTNLNQTIDAAATIPMMTAAATLVTGAVIAADANVPMMVAVLREEIISGHWNADATVPMMTAELSRGPVGNIENVIVPMMTAEATFGARCEATIPMMEMDAAVTVGRVVSGEATVPMMTAELYGTTEHLANADAAIPMMKASAYLYSGKIIRGDATIPMMAAEITAYQDIDGDINATIPMMTAEILGSPDRAACEVLRYVL